MTIHSDGFPIYRSGAGRHSNKTSYGCGYTLCDALGKFIRRDHTRAQTDFVYGEIWGILAAVSISKPGGSVVCDSQEAVTSFNSLNLNKIKLKTDQILFLHMRIKAIEEDITVGWRSRNVLTAGKYNEFRPVRALLPKCTCHETPHSSIKIC